MHFKTHFRAFEPSNSSNDQKRHQLAVKRLSRLIRKVTSNHDGDYNYINCLYLFVTESKLQSHESKDYDYCKRYDYCKCKGYDYCHW